MRLKTAHKRKQRAHKPKAAPRMAVTSKGLRISLQPRTELDRALAKLAECFRGGIEAMFKQMAEEFRRVAYKTYNQPNAWQPLAPGSIPYRAYRFPSPDRALNAEHIGDVLDAEIIGD